jgi:hypothetical protein
VDEEEDSVDSVEDRHVAQEEGNEEEIKCEDNKEKSSESDENMEHSIGNMTTTSS